MTVAEDMRPIISQLKDALAREREQREKIEKAGEALAERLRATVSMDDPHPKREKNADALNAWEALAGAEREERGK